MSIEKLNTIQTDRAAFERHPESINSLIGLDLATTARHVASVLDALSFFNETDSGSLPSESVKSGHSLILLVAGDALRFHADWTDRHGGEDLPKMAAKLEGRS